MNKKEFINALDAFCKNNNLHRAQLVVNTPKALRFTVQGVDAKKLYTEFLTKICDENNLQFTPPLFDEELGIYSYISNLTID